MFPKISSSNERNEVVSSNAENQVGQNIGSVSRLLKHKLVQNAASLYGVQIATYAVPLVTIPYLARVLGVSGWGLVAIAQGFGSYIALLGEYGFGLSATREVARQRDDRDKLADIFAGVLGAKLALVALSIPLAILASRWVSVFREHSSLLWAALFWAVAQGANVMWHFQGLERMRMVAVLDIGAKVLATVGIFLLVKAPQDGWLVLVLQGFGFLISAAFGLTLAYREIAFRLPTWAGSWNALRMGWTMFLFRSSVSLYTAGNAFILGLFVSPEFVGYYAGAEKISRAFVGILNPISQTLYPRLSHLVSSAQDRAARLARISIVMMGGAGATIGLAIFLLAPVIVHTVLGAHFGASIPVLRVLALLVPLVAIGNVLGIQWMLPLGMDSAFNKIIVTAGLINLSLALFLAPIYKDMGMAWAVVIAETFVSLTIYIVLRSRKLDPLSYQFVPKTEVAPAFE
jgi:PST family polysaccharide transporter